MMNAGKVLIGTAMIVFTVALIVTPSGAAPLDAVLPVGQEQVLPEGVAPTHSSPDGGSGYTGVDQGILSAITGNDPSLKGDHPVPAPVLLPAVGSSIGQATCTICTEVF